MNHLKQIVAKLEEYGLDAMLVTSEPGEFYAIGFHGEGLVVAAKNGCRYFTDSRYIESAEKQVTGADITMTTTAVTHRLWPSRQSRRWASKSWASRRDT